MTLVEKHELPAAPATTRPPLLPGAEPTPASTSPLRESPVLPAVSSSTARSL
jgi:hypothetical protein